MTIYELAATVLAVFSFFFTLIQAIQANRRRWIDFLRDQQKELREEKAHYDDWRPVWNKRGPEDDDPSIRHGAHHCSLAQSIMYVIDDDKLNGFASELVLYPEDEDTVKANQQVLEKALKRFAERLDEESSIWRRQAAKNPVKVW